MGGMRCDPTVQHSTVTLTQIVNLAQITKRGPRIFWLRHLFSLAYERCFSTGTFFPFPFSNSAQPATPTFFFVFFVVISTLPTDASASPFGTIDTDGTDTLDPLPSLLRIDN